MNEETFTSVDDARSQMLRMVSKLQSWHDYEDEAGYFGGDFLDLITTATEGLLDLLAETNN